MLSDDIAFYVRQNEDTYSDNLTLAMKVVEEFDIDLDIFSISWIENLVYQLRAANQPGG